MQLQHFYFDSFIHVLVVDRSIAELQVAEVKANLVSRPFDSSLSFTIHSLLIVDALQTFGTDYELLVASHKNLWLVDVIMWRHTDCMLVNSVLSSV